MGKKETETAVVVTTESRGVFFGYMNGDGLKDGNITIKRARCAISWTSSIRGFMGLAAMGPDKSCRIGPAVPSLFAMKVTSIIECTPEAVKAWEVGPWNG